MEGPSGGDVPIDELAAALAPVLGPLGLEVSFPVARIEGGIAELSPLRVRVSASDAAPALVPITDAIQPGRDALIGPVRDASGEEVDAAILLSDIALGVIAGGSKLDIELGGVTATTAEPSAAFRFGAAGGGFDLGGSTASGVAPSGGSGFSPGPTPTGAGSAALPAANGGGVEASAPGAALATTSASSTSPRGGPLLVVGLVGLAAAVGSALLDLRRVRASRRAITI